MSAVSRSPAGLARFHAIISAAICRSSASAAMIALASPGSATGSSERTTVPVSCRIRSWSAGGAPSIWAITLNGSGNASASTRSTRRSAAMAPSISSTSSMIRGRSAWIARGVNAFDTSRRSLVWSGGSRSSMDTAVSRGATSPNVASRICRSRLSAARFLSSTDRPARNSQETPSYPVSSQNPNGCWYTGACARITAYCGYGSSVKPGANGSKSGGGRVSVTVAPLPAREAPSGCRRTGGPAPAALTIGTYILFDCHILCVCHYTQRMTEVKSRREMYSEATRAALLEEATTLFAERGYSGTSLEDVASASQVTRGAVYHHFASKQALFEAVLELQEAR